MTLRRQLLRPAPVHGAVLPAACDDGTGPQDRAEVMLGFASPGEVGAAPTMAPFVEGRTTT